MTLPPERIGDKGQRFVIKYADDNEEVRTLGYAPTREGAEQMAAAWRQHPCAYRVWIVDRQKAATGGVIERQPSTA